MFPSGVSQQAVYDAAGRMDLLTLKKSDGTVVQRFDYDYGIDANGNLTANYWNGHVRSVMELDGSQVSYGYDDLNRLVSATCSGTHPFSQSYTYDANDNRTSITSGGITTNAIYDAANQLASQGSTSYSYDRNGNVLSSGDMKFVYDAANRMVGGSLVTNGAS
jgi:YD repeat-containing protein